MTSGLWCTRTLQAVGLTGSPSATYRSRDRLRSIATSVIGAFYYIKIVKIIYFDEPKEAFTPAPIGVRLVASLSAIIVLIFALAPSILTTAATAAAKSLF